MGIALEGSGVAANVMEILMIDLDALRADVEKLMTPGHAALPEGRQLPFSPRGKDALERACKESQALGHNYVGTEHLMLGLLHDDGGRAWQALSGAGLTRDDFRREVRDFLGMESYESQVNGLPARLWSTEGKDRMVELCALFREHAWIRGLILVTAHPHGSEMQKLLVETEHREYLMFLSSEHGVSPWSRFKSPFPLSMDECLELLNSPECAAREKQHNLDGYGRIETYYCVTRGGFKRVVLQGLLCTTPVRSAIDRFQKAFWP